MDKKKRTENDSGVEKSHGGVKKDGTILSFEEWLGELEKEDSFDQYAKNRKKQK